ncbi:MAG: hypothetical protein ACFE9T_02065 [Promethearchaeota archaeon]
MSEESLREIIGLANKSKWNQVKKFIKFIVQKTMRENAEYKLTALDVSINGKNQPKYNLSIKNRENIKNIDKINDFNHLSLYQSTQTSNNLIDISQNNGTIVVLAKYMGPSLNDHHIFDFSVHMDALEDPFFTNGTGKKLSCSEFLRNINLKKEPGMKIQQEDRRKALNQLKAEKVQDIEANVFEKLTNKKAIWNNTETKAFKNWKARIINKYRIESGKISHYKGKPTNLFSQYLKNLIESKTDKKKKTHTTTETKKKIPKKEIKEISEAIIFETLTSKNAIWNGNETKTFKEWKVKIANKYRKESGKTSYYKGNPTNNFTQYLRNLLKTKPKKKKPSLKKQIPTMKPKNNKVEISESSIFEALTGKNAIWNATETKNFQEWKKKIIKKYKKETGRNPYYKANLTQNFKDYLKELVNRKTN